jgi:hypothetical protein
MKATELKDTLTINHWLKSLGFASKDRVSNKRNYSTKPVAFKLGLSHKNIRKML